MCTRYPIINRVSELKVHIKLTRFVQPEKIEIDANERAVNEKSPYCFFVCTTFDSFLNDLSYCFSINIFNFSQYITNHREVFLKLSEVSAKRNVKYIYTKDMDRKSGREDAAGNDNTEENSGRVPPALSGSGSQSCCRWR